MPTLLCPLHVRTYKGWPARGSPLLEEFLPVKSVFFICNSSQAPVCSSKLDRTAHKCIFLSSTSWCKPPCSPVVRVKRAGTARGAGCVGTKGLVGKSNAEIPPGVKFLGSLRTYKLWPGVDLGWPLQREGGRLLCSAPGSGKVLLLRRGANPELAPCLNMALLQT